MTLPGISALPRMVSVAMATCLVVATNSLLATPDSLDSLRKELASGSPITLVAFGDSVTGIYYHTGGQRAWPELLAEGLRVSYPQSRVEVINAGVSGNTTGQALARLDRDVLARHPQWIVAMFGLNDVAKGRGPPEFRANLEVLVTRAQQAHSAVILLTPNPVLAGDPERSPEAVGEYAAIVREVASRRQVPLADAFQEFALFQSTDALRWEKMMSQAIHPNLFGHAIFAHAVLETIASRQLSLEPPPPLQATWAHLQARVAAGKPIRVRAMPPCDEWVTDGLMKKFPAATVQVRTWGEAGRHSLGELAEAVKHLNRFHGEEPDLVVLACPPNSTRMDPGEVFRKYSEIMNATLAFGASGWDYLAVGASVISRQAVSEDSLAREVARGKDLPWLGRETDDSRSPRELLAESFVTAR